MSVILFLILCFVSCNAGDVGLFAKKMTRKCNGIDHYGMNDHKDILDVCNSVKTEYRARYGKVAKWKCKLFVKNNDLLAIKVKIRSRNESNDNFIHILVDDNGKLIVQQKGFFKRNDCIQLSEHWENYGNLLGGTRYSPLDEINIDNVKNLKIAWTFRYGPSRWGYEADKKLKNQQAPIMVDDGSIYGNDLLIICTPWRAIVALNPITGEQIWRNEDGVTVHSDGIYANTCRGVATWVDPLKSRGTLCKRSVYLPTIDRRLIAVDAATGKNCTDFGIEGAVDLDVVAITNPECVFYLNPPTIVRDTLVVGQAIADYCGYEAPKGFVPAFHARTGKFLWTFMIIPIDPTDPAMKTYRDGTENVGAGNAWAPLGGDNELGLVYVPTTSANLDHIGTHRIGDNHYCNSLVALNVSDGKVVWFRQFVHHDVFDYDINNHPVVGEITHDGKKQKVVLQGTKMGFLFVLNAADGEPIFGIKEQPVPTFSELPGEILSPTQPFPVDDFLKLAKTSADLRPGKDLWGRNAENLQSCVDFMNSSGLDPIGEIYMPARISRPVLWVPGAIGGMNLGGSVALDTNRSIAVAATQNDYFIHQLLPQNTSSVPKWCHAFHYNESEGVPFADCYGASSTKEKCYKPPWAMLHAVDLANGRKLWSIPHGTSFNVSGSTEEEGSSWYSGGILVTAGSLVIAGNTEDRYLRAFNIDTGEQLYKSSDPMAAMAAGNPITYRTGGKQYIVLVASGHNFFGMYPHLPKSDHIYAFALP